MTAPTSLIGMVDDTQYGTIVADVYEHIPDLYYPASVPVFAEMRRDARLTAVVDGYALQIRRAQWQVDGAGCRPEVTQFVADCLGLNVVGEDKATGARRRGVSWNDHLRSALLCQVFGHYCFEMEATIDRDGRARLTTLAERIPATIMAIHADPKTGDLLGIDQQVMTSRRTGPQIPAKNLVFYSRNREGASWQGTSLLRPAYAPWLLKREMLRVNAISNRRWGAGVPVAEALPGTNPSPAMMAEAQRLASAARAGDQAGAAVPAGFTLKIVGLSGSLPDTLGFIRLLNQEMSGSVLMPHLDLGTSDSGSRALGESFIDSWTLALESEAEAIADTATRQAAVRIVDWNWGEDEPVPRIVVSGVGSRREVTAESLKMLLDAGALSVDPRLEAWVRREYRLPERDPNAPKPLPAGPPARAPEQPVEEEPAGTEEQVDEFGNPIEPGQVQAAAKRFEDHDHPRKNDGKFSRTPGGGGSHTPGVGHGAGGGNGRGATTSAPTDDAPRNTPVNMLLDPANPTTRATLADRLAAGEGSPDERKTWAAAVAEFDSLADEGEQAGGGKGFDRFRAQLSLAEDPDAVVAERWSKFKTDAVRAAALRSLWAEKADRDKPAAPSVEDIELGQDQAARLAAELPPERLTTKPVKIVGTTKTLPDGGDNPPDFRFVEDPEDRATFLWQKRYETQQAVRLGVLNLAAGNDPDDGWKMPDSLKQFISDDFTEQDLRDSLNDASRRIYNRFAAAGSSDGELYRGMYVAGTPEQVQAMFAEGVEVGLPVASFTRSYDEARQYSTPADLLDAPRPSKGGVSVVMTVKGKKTAVDLSGSTALQDSREAIMLGRLRVTRTVYGDTSNVLYVMAEEVPL